MNVLVRTILSQHTNDKNSDMAYLRLRRKFPNWSDVMNASPLELEKTIRCGGLARIKSERILATLKAIQDREGKLSLNGLKTLSTQKALTYLTSLPGIGIKTACCVMIFAFGRPVMPVDTHVSRVAVRLGWVKPETRVDKMHELLEQLIPKQWIFPMHLYVIRHGRKICRAHNPKCTLCPISRHCPYPTRS